VPGPALADAHRAQSPAEESRLPVRARRAARALASLAAVLLVASCATTPALDRHILQAEASSTRSANVKGSHGYLSREQSKAVIEKLKSQSPDAGVLERHLAIEQSLSGDPLSVGNRVMLLEDGKQTYEAMLKAIRAARHHIHVETYIFEADDTGNLFADAFIAKAQAGVKVRVIYDAVGCIKTPKEFFKRMADGGVELLEFNPILKGGIDELNQRDHRKLTIVDGRIAFLGGINISDVYGASSGGSSRMRDEPVEKRPWRDLQSSVEGPAVNELQRVFLTQWARRRKEAPIEDRAYYPTQPQAGPHVVRVMAGSPADEGINDVYAAMISAIDNAEKEVRIINPYFVPPRGPSPRATRSGANAAWRSRSSFPRTATAGSRTTPGARTTESCSTRA
jgi:cardiolipin synthase